MAFDLGKFRDLAFWREPLPDHPLQDVDDAKRIIGLLPEDNPDYSLADRTQLDLPIPNGMQRIRVTRLIDDNEHYQRVLFESLGVTKA